MLRPRLLRLMTDNPAMESNMDATTARAPDIRPAAPSDESAIDALLRTVHLPVDGVRDALPNFVIAEDEGRIVGIAGVETCGPTHDHALLRSVAVDPAWQGKGLGHVLVERALVIAEARGVKELYLLTTTAENFFPRFGFATTTRDAVPADVSATAEFQGACPASATVMVRRAPVAPQPAA